MAWNQRVSLTTITEPREIAVKHFLDSLTCLWGLPAGFQLSTVLDVGSGAGFPGLPLKIYDPDLQVTSWNRWARRRRSWCTWSNGWVSAGRPW